MSNRQVSRVWEMRGLPAHLKLPLLRLADHANSEGLCFPGQASLARDCDVSERSIRYAINALDRLGLVERVKRRRRGTQIYQLHLPDEDHPIDWAQWTTKIIEDVDLELGHGWFSQDRPQVAGQTTFDSAIAETSQDRPQVADLPGVKTGSKTGSRLHQDRQPTSGKTGSPLPVPKGNPHRTPSKNRARSFDHFEAGEAALRDLALELARSKGARNPEGLARIMLEEDRDELIEELDRRDLAADALLAIARCGACDSNGFIERDGAMWRCDHSPQQAEAAQ